MTDTLAQLTAKIQAAFIDDGTRFSTATCTAAIREALKEFNLFVPVYAGDLITVVANQKVYEVSAVDSRALAILDVLEQDSSDGDDDESLPHDPYHEDERLFFRLRTALASGTLVVRFTIPHTIQNLDSATESTLSALHDQILVNGACAEALAVRARSRVETINLQQGVSDNYLDQIKSLHERFRLDLVRLSAARRAARGEPSEAAWNDAYHTWDQ